MALPKKGTGSGTKAYISTDGSEFTQFLSVSKVSPPDYSRGTVDLTDNASYDDNNQMKEFGVGFVEAGELKIEGWHRTDDTGITAAEEAFFAGTPVQIKLVSPPWLGKTLVFPGIITGLQTIGSLEPENGVPYSVTVKPTGKPVITSTQDSV